MSVPKQTFVPVHHIEECLSSYAPSSCLQDLKDDSMQAKENIRSSVNKLVCQLRLREQWLLNHVDQIQNCMFQILQFDARKNGQIRGKLQSCLDVSSRISTENEKLFCTYAMECMEEYKNLEKQEPSYERSSIAFISDEDQLLQSIQEFGKLSGSAVHDFVEDSEKSWDFAESETSSCVSESSTADKCAASLCHASCSNVAYEIEDMDKRIDLMNRSPVSKVTRVCRANEPCSDMRNCLFDVPCASSLDDHRTDGYAAQIERDMNEITRRKSDSYAADNNPCIPNHDLADHSSHFVKTVINLENEFERILLSDHCRAIEAPFSAKKSSKLASGSVESASSQIDDILNGQSLGNGILPGPEIETTCSVVSQLSSDLNAIISSPNSSSPSFLDVPNSDRIAKMMKLDKSDYLQFLHQHRNENKQVLKLDQSMDTEKQDSCEKILKVDENVYLAKGREKWSSVTDVNDIVLGILGS